MGTTKLEYLLLFVLSVAGLHLLQDEIDRKSPRLFLLDLENSGPGEARRSVMWWFDEAITEV